jgi:putative endonuclease
MSLVAQTLPHASVADEKVDVSDVNVSEAIWSVYLIRDVRQRLYCGVTTNVARRFAEHQQGKIGAKALKGQGPLMLAWHQPIGDKRLAMQLEYRIKQLKKSQKEALVTKQCVLTDFANCRQLMSAAASG